MAKIKIQITIDEELLAEVDDYCDKQYVNRSSLISQSLVQVINQQKLIDTMHNVGFAVKKAAEAGTIDDNTRKELEQFEALCRIFSK